MFEVPRPWRIMSIMAHQDDFEFNAGGSFALLRKTYGQEVQFKIVATSRGATGHHEMDLDATFHRRSREAIAAAARIGATYECLTQLDGSHVHAQVLVDRNLLGGLWNVIREYEPHVIFCPPVTRDPLAGIHVDHESTAMAVRMVAYQLVVPRAYPTTRGPMKLRVPRPLILNVDDVYASEGHFDIRQDIRGVWQEKVAMSLCHESQVFEWLPFGSGRPAPTREQWEQSFVQRHRDANARYGRHDDVQSEYFRITRWGRPPAAGELALLFPRCIE